MGVGRLLVIDASLAPRIATVLGRRGREAVSVASVADTHLLDPELLEHLRTEFASRNWALITADDHMPRDHAEHVAGLTVATVDGRWEGRWPEQEQWQWESVMRWAHYVADRQRPMTVRRLSPFQQRPWTSR